MYSFTVVYQSFTFSSASYYFYDIVCYASNITKCNLLIRGRNETQSHLALEGDFPRMRSLIVSQWHIRVMVQGDPLSGLIEGRPGGAFGVPVREVSLPSAALLYTTSAADFLSSHSPYS